MGHIPVLLQEAIALLDIKPGQKYIDATLGSGGHAADIISRGGLVLGLDQDPLALKACPDLDGLIKVRANFTHLAEVADTHHWSPVSGILFDLGLSSLQLDDPGRGLSFQTSGPLDMRLDPDLLHTAATLVNHLPAKQLAKIFKDFGEIPTSNSLAKKIISARPLATTLDLAKLAGLWSRQAFLALRIAVNDELGALKSTLPQAGKLLGSGCRLVVISFHSLEDRIVKDQFRDWEKGGQGRILTPTPLRPPVIEVQGNPRSKSAKLRAYENF